MRRPSRQRRSKKEIHAASTLRMWIPSRGERNFFPAKNTSLARTDPEPAARRKHFSFQMPLLSRTLGPRARWSKGHGWMR